MHTKDIFRQLLSHKLFNHIITDAESWKIWHMHIVSFKGAEWYFNGVDRYGSFIVFFSSFSVNLQFECELQ